MKKLLLGALLVSAFGLVFAGTALAAPVGPAEGFSIYAEYSDFWGEEFIVGGGYGFGENLAVGVFYNPDWDDVIGLYGNLAFGPFRVNAEIITDFEGYEGNVAGLFVFDLDVIALGVGAGTYIWDGGGFEDFYLEGTAEFKLDALTVYGAVTYDLEWEDTSFWAGVRYAF